MHCTHTHTASFSALITRSPTRYECTQHVFHIRSVCLSDNAALFKVGFTLFVVACCAQIAMVFADDPYRHHHRHRSYTSCLVSQSIDCAIGCFGSATHLTTPLMLCYSSDRVFAQSVFQQFKASFIDSREVSFNNAKRLSSIPKRLEPS